MKLFEIVGLGIVVFSVSGCALVSGGNAAVAGGIYSGYKSPGQVGTAAPAKTGEACAMSILGLVGIGDASITAAKQAGGITQIAHVDHDNMSVLGVYGKTCTIVSGS